MKNVVRVSAIAAFAAALAPGSASAQSSTEDVWRFQAILYGYFPTTGGTTTFPPTGAASSVNIDADTILKNLEGVFMGTFEASRGR